MSETEKKEMLQRFLAALELLRKAQQQLETSPPHPMDEFTQTSKDEGMQDE